MHDHDQAGAVIHDVTIAMGRAHTAVEACQAAVDALARHAEAMSAVLLRDPHNLRCVAAAGSWQVLSTVPPHAGVVGRAYSSGLTQVVTDVTADPDYIALGPPVEIEICAPVPGPGGPIGALNLEFVKSVDTFAWRDIAEATAVCLGARITELDGPPAESSSEKLVRHGLRMSAAETEPELAQISLYAARDVSGMDAAVIALRTPDDGYEVIIDKYTPSKLAQRLAAIPIGWFAELIDRTQKQGPAYTIGDPADHNAAGSEVLTSLGVRSMITIPVGVHSPLGGALITANECTSRADSTTVALLSLLAAQAWTNRERIRHLATLQERAISDPLTGLRHQSSFGEHLATAPPEQTAVFAIDVDGFKSVNDTYGHQAGDRALVAVAQALTTALRAEDELYRVGGDEFAALVPVYRTEEATGIANRLLGAARAVGHTISIGIALRRISELPEETVARADSALYLAKRSGRDNVQVSPVTPS